jgi:integrase
MNKPSVYFGIDYQLTSGVNAGKYHVRLWVTFKDDNWNQVPYKTNVFCTKKEFDVLNDHSKKRLPILVQDIKDKLDPIRKRAEHIIELGFTSQSKFESYFLSEYETDSVALDFERKIKELEAAKKFSSREKYVTSLKSFKEFFGDGFTFSECTPDRLQEYEDWYVGQDRSKKKPDGRKKSLTSVGINMRNLRHIFKRNIKAGIIPERLYPFGVGKYVIPEGGDDTKKFLSTEEKDAFINWQTDDEKLKRLHAYAVFCYYSYGINMSDFARLRKSSVFKDYIAIDRQKTKGRKKKKKKLIIPIHPAMQEIINRYGKRSLVPDDYVFPVLDIGMDEKAIFYKIRDLVDDVNDMLAIVGKELNFEIKPTSYTIRHTFSFHFMQLGGTTDELQDALAHGSSKTTENYKHGFALERKKKFSEGL